MAYSPFDDGQASGLYGQTLYCPEHHRWITWQGGYEPHHQRPCPECRYGPRDVVLRGR
jgi:hypothetical protein